MPRYSEERKTHLLTVEEAAVATGKSTKTITRRLAGQQVYVEYHYVKGRVGAARTAFVDVRTLGLPILAEGHVLPQACGGTLRKDTPESAEGHGENHVLALPKEVFPPEGAQACGGTLSLSLRTPVAPVPRTPLDPETHALHERLQPVFRTRKNSQERRVLVEAIAGELEVSPAHVYRWIRALEASANSPYALARRQRADKGARRFPEEVRELVTAAFLNNRPGVSANAIYRALKRSVPHLMAYTTKSGTVKHIEPHTVRAIRQELMEDPAMQLMFRDTTQRKEFLRVYNGRVHALHANAQWQMDMTRCDVEVFNPVSRRFYRLRIHAVIDVFSGCIMGLAFSEDEDQAQTNIALMRALTPKTGRYAHLYPMYGTPNTIYWDNGKTYRSGEVERIVSTLGINSIHSLPRVSHTRGAVERFFGTLHGMIERSLTGYAGMNAVSRDSEELRALRDRTLRWADTGRDPGRQQRHLTEEEFKSIVLMWLVTEYHQMVQDGGLTRQEKFLASVQDDAARHTLRHYDPQELFMLFCRQTSRVVTPDSGVLYKNRLFKSPTGALAGYAGKTVLLMEDSFSLDGWHGVVFPRRDGTYVLLGDVEPAPEWADSAESAHVRQVEKGARRALVERVTVEAERNRRPELNIAESLVRGLPPADPRDLPVVDVTPTPLPTSRARLATTDRQEDVGTFGKFLDAGQDAQTADEFMAALKNTLPGRKK